MIESKIERAMGDHARSFGAMWVKLEGTRGLPDRMLLYDGRVVFFEIKRHGGRIRPQQMRWAASLQANGFGVYIVDNIENGKRIIERFVAKSAPLSD